MPDTITAHMATAEEFDEWLEGMLERVREYCLTNENRHSALVFAVMICDEQGKRLGVEAQIGGAREDIMYLLDGAKKRMTLDQDDIMRALATAIDRLDSIRAAIEPYKDETPMARSIWLTARTDDLVEPPKVTE